MNIKDSTIDELKKRKKLPSEKRLKYMYSSFYILFNNWSVVNKIEDLKYIERLYLYINGIDNRKICTCGKYTKFSSSVKGYRDYCSTKCVMLDPINVDKIRKTCIIRYGVDNASKSDIIKAKKVETSISNSGVEYNSQRSEMRERLSSLMHINSSKLNKAQRKNRDNYIIDKLKKFDENIQYVGYDIDEMVYICKCDKGHEFKINKNNLNDRIRYNNRICTVCNKIGSGSDAENKLYEFISSKVDNVLRNQRMLDGKELDVYLPDLNIAFEYNGIYWHSSKYKDKNYHLDKTNKSLEKGIHLIHIYEDEWLSKRDIVQSMILNVIGELPNIDCYEVSTIDMELSKSFLTNNHIKGYIDSDVSLGLFNNANLVSLMSFNKINNSEWEIIRFCDILYKNVIDSHHKLFNYFKDNYNFKEVTTCLDRSWNNGNLYEEIGFELLYITEPNYCYVSGNKRYFELKENYNLLYDSGDLKYSYKY